MGYVQHRGKSCIEDDLSCKSIRNLLQYIIYQLVKVVHGITNVADDYP